MPAGKIESRCSHTALRIACLLAPLWMLPATAEAARPNIVVILADDLGWADLGCYGNTFNETPHIDRLAAQGMRWTQAYAGPVCSPTRANMQSGRDQARYGITQHIPGHRRPYARLVDPAVPRQLSLSVETFAERLAAVGYRTGYFGKWHLGGGGFGPDAQGWQTSLECRGNTVPPSLAGGQQPRRTAAFLTERATEFIAAHSDTPFLLQVSHFAVHIPLSTTPELLAKYRAKRPMPGYPSRPEYAGLLEELDQSVGLIVQAVERAGIGERTLILLLSDNGGLEHEQDGRIVTSNAPLRGEKGTLYEGGIRVPAIGRWTGHIPPNTVSDTPISSMDWYSTFTELAGTGSSSDAVAPNSASDGLSLVPLLYDPTARLARRRRLFWHLPHYHHSTPASAIRRDDWKLIEFFEDDHVELYDLRTDPAEQTDLAAHQPEIARSLRADLQSWRERVSAELPRPNPHYDPARAEELAGPRSHPRPVP